MKRSLLVACTVLLALSSNAGMAAQHDEDPARLVVATKVSPPFSYRRADGSWTGISIELWRRIAESIGAEYEFREMELNDMIDRLVTGEVDCALAAISVTAERDRKLDFSHVYFTTGLGIAVPRIPASSLWRVMRGLLTARFFEIFGGLMLVSVIVGVLFWKLEQRNNKLLFGGPARDGVSMGLWWSATLMLGHKGIVPATGCGRVLAALVMITSILAVSMLTGVLASVITLNRLGVRIGHPDDLRHVRTITVASSTSEDFLESRHIRHRAYPTIDAALGTLVAKKADAVVYDLAMLKHRCNSDTPATIEVLPQSFNLQYYAIALQPNSKLRKPVNQALLTITSSDEWSDVLYRYLGE